MKKVVLFIALMSTVAFTSCSNDDDDVKKCASCSLLGISVEACDNGDGTVTVTSAGQSETLSGESAAEYVKALEDGCPVAS